MPATISWDDLTRFEQRLLIKCSAAARRETKIPQLSMVYAPAAWWMRAIIFRCWACWF
jgi:hypothetical protein